MHLLIASKKSQWGSIAQLIYQTACGMLARGHRVSLATVPNRVLEQKMHGLNVTTIPVRFDNKAKYTFDTLLDYRRLSCFIRRERVDIIHAHTSWDHWIGGITARKGPRRIPLVRTKHNLNISKSRFLNWCLYNRLADRVIAPSSAVSTLMEPVITGSRIELIPNGIDLEHYNSGEYDTGSIRRQAGCADGEMLVGFVSRFSPSKGPERFINAAALVTRQAPNVRFVMAGSGQEYYIQRMKQLAREVCPVTFLPFQKDVRPLLSALDILVCPSVNEGFGLTTVEGMAMAKPVVVSTAPAFRDFVRHEKNGLVADPPTARQIANEIIRLCASAQLRSKLGSAASDHVRTRFSIGNMVCNTEALYLETIEQFKRAKIIRSA